VLSLSRLGVFRWRRNNMAGRGVIQCHELKMRNSKTRCQLPHAMWCVAVDPNIQFHLPLRATN
ncbi:unnamed protein product, partial [Musa banksii]